MSIQFEFVGAARTVTGSRHLLRTKHSTILLDCGQYQGHREEARQLNTDLGFDPNAIDAVVLSHAHIDHSGALPMLCKGGYRGPIFATPATRDLTAVMLEDAAMIQANDAAYLNRRNARHHIGGPPIEPLYEQTDVNRVLEQMTSIPYHARHRIAPDVQLTLLDAGHVLGSAVVVLDVDDEGKQRRVAFTGDLGRAGMPILRDPEIPPSVEALISESTYGDRIHSSRAAMDEELATIIRNTSARNGKVVIPSFALERAQEILLSLQHLRLTGAIPPIPVFVDSPLAVNITEVFQLHPECFDGGMGSLMRSGHSPFEFEGLRFVRSTDESKEISARHTPCVIISASGMCEGGRVLHHLKATMEDPKHAIVIIGFQAQHTLGRRIVERRPRVRVFGVERDLRAEVHVLNGFSAHADQLGLIDFAERVREKGPLKQVFLVHGETQAQEALRSALSERGFGDVRIPARGDVISV